MPLDGHRAARQIGSSSIGVYCHAPVASSDGSLVVLQVDKGVDQTATFTFGRP